MIPSDPMPFWLTLGRPALVTLTIFTFIGNYNNLFWPLVLILSM